MDTFNFLPNTNSSGDVRPDLLRAKFGDGYEMTAPNGLNNVRQSWPLVFEGNLATITPIKNFLDAHLGARFYWTPPLGTQGIYMAQGYRPVDKGAGNYEISVTFEQTFQP